MATDYKYDKREITHGASYGGFASIATKEDGTLDKEQPVRPFTGIISATFETSQESTPFHADNVEHVRVSGAKSTEGSIKCYQFPKAFVTKHLGKKTTENGGLIDTGSNEAFIFQYIETVTDEFGKDTRKLTIHYNVKATAPKGESTSDTDSVTPVEYEIPVTASPNNAILDEEGKAVTSFELLETEENKNLFDYALTHIILPDTLAPTV